MGTEIHGRTCPGNFYTNYTIYSFQLAKRPLHFPSAGCSAKCSEILMHHALFYEDEIFEFLPTGYQRKKKKNCYDRDEYELDESIKGYSNLSPDELDEYIIKNGDYNNTDYKKVTHNCQHFVLFCLKKLDHNLAQKYKIKYYRE